ncbi:MAG: Rdx family protein [Actinobacteria bacterium]|nr:Rdx family protein [Actinomycetota bacterium]
MRTADDLITNYQHVIETFTFTMGSKGVFDVIVDGELLFSKHQLGRHAEPGEVLELFTEKHARDVPRYQRD